MTKLEVIYRDMCSKAEQEIYFHTYMAVKKRLEISFLNYTKDKRPFRTDHGIRHVERILEKMYRFLTPHLPIADNIKDRMIDLDNLHLVMHTALWHDVGYLYDDKNHSDKVSVLFRKVAEFLYDGHHHKPILKICKDHSSHCLIKDTHQNKPIIHIGDSVICIYFLSALLRISDELDEDFRRIESRILSEIPQKNKAYWEFCKRTKSIMPTYASDSNGVKRLYIMFQGEMSKSDIWDKWGKDNGEVTAIEEYIGRIDKINKERIYCNKYLTEHNTIYFTRIDAIEISIDIVDNDNIINVIQYAFTDDNGYNDFFIANKDILENYRS